MFLKTILFYFQKIYFVLIKKNQRKKCQDKRVNFM